MQYRPIVLIARTVAEMATRDANHLSAGVAYYAIFALFPTLLGVMVISDLLLESMEVRVREAFLRFIIGNLPGSDTFIRININQIVEQRNALVAVSIVGLLWSSGAIFEAINRVVNRAWGIYHSRPFHISRLLHLISLVIFGLLFILWFVISYVLQILHERDLGIPGQQIFLASGRLHFALNLSSWMITLAIFLIIYRYLPNCRVYWRHVWPGALLAAVLLESAKSVFTWYLSYSNYTQLYGTIAASIAFLLWVYLSALILTLGAEVCYQYQRVYYPRDVRKDPSPWDM